MRFRPSHTGVAVTDVDRARHVYLEGLGFAFLTDPDRDVLELVHHSAQVG